jgi:anti-sigma factor RsiW
LREQLEGSLTCGEAEFAISRQLDGRLERRERGQLRAHLRECSECAAFARRQRAQRGALKTLALVPVPSSLTSLFGGGSGTAIGTGLTLKAAAAVTAGLAIGGAGYEGVQHAPWQAQKSTSAHAQKAVVRVAPVGALSQRGPSRAGPASTSRGHGQASKAANVKAKKLKQVSAHGRANRTRSNGHASKATHARGAQQLHRAQPSRGALMHKKAQPKRKRLQLPGPIGENPAPPPRQAKRKK